MTQNFRYPTFLNLMLTLGLISASHMSAWSQTAAPQTPRSYTEGEKGKVKGVIISRNGDLLTVRDWENEITIALLENEAKVELTTAWWGKRKDPTVLTPGLRVELEGRGNSQGQLSVHKIKFGGGDLKMAQAISGGLTPLANETAQLRDQQGKLEGQQTQLQNQQQRLEGQQSEMQIVQNDMKNKQTDLQNQQQQTQQDLQRTQQETATLSRRFSELDDYETKDTAVVNFATGKANLTPEAKQTLDGIADKALNSQGYVVEVAGHADSTGREGFNKRLSARRADAVVNYLEEVKRVPLRRVAEPSGLGTSQPVAGNKTASGRAQNRRAEVKIMVNKGLAPQK
jgi:outer membrane protein OmpA-like peptidoglycan-associated protein